jgi:antirestriction protein ArdC
MQRLRTLGINLKGSRNTALQELVSEIPAPLVAEMLGYSDQVTQRHAELVGVTWSMYANTRNGLSPKVKRKS